MEVQYAYSVRNSDQENAVNVLGLMRMRNTDTADLTDEAVGANPLAPGDVVVVREFVKL